MTETQLKEFRARLLEQQSQLNEDIVSLQHSDAETKLDVGAEPAERAAMESERTVVHKHEFDEANLLEKVQFALSRIDEGTYEQCATCGNAIPLERLMAKPSVSLCVACQEKKEAASS